jgi:hypothetical protein
LPIYSVSFYPRREATISGMILRIAVWAFSTAMIVAGMGCSARQNQGETPSRQPEETAQRSAPIEETTLAASAGTTEGRAAT